MTIIFEGPADLLSSRVQTLVVPVNTVGVMGSGLALAFANRYPGLLKPYQRACRQNVFSDKGIFVYTASEERKLLCLPTKRHWRNPSKLVWIDTALAIIAKDYAKYQITELALPMIGCGLGGLYWSDVRKLIYQHLAPSRLEVGIFLSE